MKKRKITWKTVLFFSSLLTVTVLLLHSNAYALEEKDTINILVKNDSLFESNSIAGTVLRYIGWGITCGLVAVGNMATKLYDTCFGFVDFTKVKAVNSFIKEWKDVFIALVCLSILFIGILLCVGWEKKPKIAINLLIAVMVVTSSTYIMGKLNSFISSEVRSEIIGDDGGDSVVLKTVSMNIHDLVYLDKTVGLQNLNKKGNAKKTYSSFTQQQFDNLSITETVDADDVKDEAADIVENGIITEYDDKNNAKYNLEELYDGVAWTDLLNEYYYRYTVDWGVMWMQLLSLIIIYIFMSYKVISILFEIVVHRILAYLYAANLNNNQKILKILDSLKDSYILLLMTTVIIKLYLLACNYISNWDVSGMSKGFILLFLAFAVINGPNIVQKLTGTDVGASDGMGKMMSLFYGGRMAAGAAGAAARTVKHGVGAAKRGIDKVAGKGAFSETMGANAAPGMTEAAAGAAGMDSANDPDHTTNNSSTNSQSQNQNNRQNNHANINESMNSPNSNMNTMNAENSAATDSEKGGGDNGNSSKENQSMQSGKESSTMSAGQGKQDGGYNNMNQIGKGIQSNREALNGLNTDRNLGEGNTGNLRSMDKEIASGFHSGSTEIHQEMSNSPIGTAGHILKDSASGISKTKSIFEENKSSRR